MNYNEITIFTTTAGAEILGGLLSRFGIDQFAVEDPEDLRQFLESGQNWDYVEEGLLEGVEARMKIYLPDTPEGVESIMALEQNLEEFKNIDFGVDMGSLEVKKGFVREEEWSESWKKYYKPFEVGKRFVIRPCWEEAGDAGGRIVVSLNPGMVFGTGMHASTRLCLEFLEEAVNIGDKVLDIGTGSGILAVGALLLGAKDTVAVDIDPIAQGVVRENAALNGFGEDRVKVLIGDILEGGALHDEIGKGFDIVLANIVADVIIRLCDTVPEFLKSGGMFVCSGIIEERLFEVEDALKKAGFDIYGVKKAEGWCAVLAKLM